MQTILVTERLEDSIIKDLKKSYRILTFKSNSQLADPLFLEELKTVDAALGLINEVNADFLDLVPQIKVISSISVGYNHLDINELTRRGIMATHTPNVLNDTVADMVIGLMLAAARRIPELDQYVKSKQWKSLLATEYYGLDVHHKTVGIIGMGRIGKTIAKRAHFGFDMDVLYHSRTEKKDVENLFDAKYCDLNTLLEESDYVVLITPLTEETRGMIGYSEFKLMKETAIFINASRGPTVIESDLIKAIENKEIKAAGLDVYEQEPTPHDNKLLKFNNVVTLPHIGSATLETELKMSQMATQNVLDALNGLKPKQLINQSVWND